MTATSALLAQRVPATVAYAYANPMGLHNAPSFILTKREKCSPNPWEGEVRSLMASEHMLAACPTNLQQPIGGLKAEVQCVSNVVNLLLTQAVKEVYVGVETAG